MKFKMNVITIFGIGFIALGTCLTYYGQSLDSKKSTDEIKDHQDKSKSKIIENTDKGIDKVIESIKDSKQETVVEIKKSEATVLKKVGIVHDEVYTLGKEIKIVNGTNITDIEYPSDGLFGINILCKDITQYKSGSYSFQVKTPKDKQVKVEVKGHQWFFSMQPIKGWIFSDGVPNAFERTFTTIDHGDAYLIFHIEPKTKIEITVYENNKFTWSKTINVE